MGSDQSFQTKTEKKTGGIYCIGQAHSENVIFEKMSLNENITVIMLNKNNLKNLLIHFSQKRN